MSNEAEEIVRGDLDEVLNRWREALERGVADDIVRDSAILRFELAFEVTWKLLQRLARKEGLEVNSPRQAFQAAFSLGWIEDEEIWKEILIARNTAIHVYRKRYADALAAKLAGYHEAFSHLRKRIP
jgi:nucleotidyltransferase substrate binding protein (TIGR01987 family)